MSTCIWSKIAKMRKLENVVDWEKIYKQNAGYKELDKLKVGNIGSIQYYPVDPEEHNKWFEEQKAKEKLNKPNYPEKKDIKS